MGFIDRDVRVWWYALKRLLAAVDRVACEHAARVYAYAGARRAPKILAYRSIRALLQARPLSADQLLEQLFGGPVLKLRGLSDDDLMTPEDARALSRDPQVTIGASAGEWSIVDRERAVRKSGAARPARGALCRCR